MEFQPGSSLPTVQFEEFDCETMETITNRQRFTRMNGTLALDEGIQLFALTIETAPGETAAVSLFGNRDSATAIVARRQSQFAQGRQTETTAISFVDGIPFGSEPGQKQDEMPVAEFVLDRSTTDPDDCTGEAIVPMTLNCDRSVTGEIGCTFLVESCDGTGQLMYLLFDFECMPQP